MELGLRLPTTGEHDPAAFAVRAEERGFESVWQGELWGWNVFVQLAEVAVATDEVRLGTAVVNVYSRTPAVIAMSAASLDQLSDGRAIIGLGVSTPKTIEDLHSCSFERPIRRTRETGELVAAFLADGDSVEYSGEIFDVADFPGLSEHVPLYNAALGEANLAVTGRQFDGWLPNNIPFSALDESFDSIAENARNAGRDPDQIEVAPWIHVAVDDDPERAKEVIRDTVAYYVGSGEGYKNAVGAVFPDEAAEVASAWQAGNRDEARSRITDEMVAELGCAGPPGDVRDQLRSLVTDTVVDLPIVDIPPFAPDDIVEQSFQAVAPDAF